MSEDEIKKLRSVLKSFIDGFPEEYRLRADKLAGTLLNGMIEQNVYILNLQNEIVKLKEVVTELQKPKIDINH